MLSGQTEKLKAHIKTLKTTEQVKTLLEYVNELPDEDRRAVLPDVLEAIDVAHQTAARGG